MSPAYLPDLDVADHEPLMHYIRADFFRVLLAERSLHLNRQDKQDKDAADGLLATANPPSSQDAALLRSINPSMTDETIASFTKSQSHAINMDRKLRYLHSWTMRAEETDRLWKEFGDDGKGVCIKTTCGRLKEAVNAVELIPRDGFVYPFPGRIKNEHGFMLTIQIKRAFYSASSPVVISYFATTKKAPDLQSKENEARVEASISCDAGLNFYADREPPLSQKLPVKIDRLFEAVFMGPKMDEATASELSRLADDAAGSRVARRSQLKN